MRRPNTYVHIYYKGSFFDGEVFDQRCEGEPLRVLLGANAVLKGLEDALFDMGLGEERSIVIDPDNAYGHYEPDAVFKIPLNIVPHADELPVGEHIRVFSKKTNRPAYAKGVEVKDYHAVVDLNHPLADKTLQYWVKIVKEEENG